MPTTVGSHAVATFTSPVNGTSPIDANQVRGNDNTLRTSYVSHDADPGIHVQSSTLSSRPTAGVAGRKWITADTGSYKLWYDDGTTWHEVSNSGVDVFVVAGGNLVKGDVVKVTGYNLGVGAPNVAKVASAADVAFGIVSSASIANGATGYITNTGLVQDVNTAAYNIGDILYPNASGGLTATKPTSGTYQPAAYVLRSNANNGVLYVEFSGPRIVERSDNTASTVVLRDASGNFAAGTITAALTGNASTATALQNTRTLWGQNFNGTANVTGNLSSVGDIAMTGALSGATSVSATTLAGTLSTAAQPNVTSVGTLSSLAVTGNLTLGADVVLSRGAANRLDVASGDSVNVVSGKYQIGGTDVLTSNTLGSGVTASSLTSVGTLSSLTVSGNLTVDTNTLFVDAVNNRVGVGTTSPVAALHAYVTGTSSVALPANISGLAGVLVEGSVANASTWGLSFQSGGGGGAAIAAARGGAFDTTLIFGTSASGDGSGSITEQMRIASNGNVGIGGIVPSERLDVNGLVRARAEFTAFAESGTDRVIIAPLATGNGATFRAVNAANNAYTQAVVDGSSVSLQIASTERARITAGGALLVNTTAAYGAERLCVSNNDNLTAPLIVWNKDTTGDNFFAGFVTEGGAGTLRGTIQYNRGAGQVAYNVTSDERLKHNIADADDAGALIDAMQVRQFDWKETGNHLDYGFIAQELHAVAPHAVTVPADEDAMWAVDYSKLVPMLVKEIQSLRARVAALEAK